MRSTGSAFGKIILLGEHAVVLGYPALAAALDRGVVAEAERKASGGIVLEGVIPGSDFRVRVEEARVLEAAQRVAQRAGVQHAEVLMSAELPLGGGLGSSGAFGVALFRALSRLAGKDPSDSETLEAAMDSECIFHGSPSGVDPAVSALGGVLLFRRGEPPVIEHLSPPTPLKVVVALSGVARSTAVGVASLLERCEQEPEIYRPIVERLGELAASGAQDLRSGQVRELGAKMNEAHELLARCELSCAELDQMVSIARKAGALGAKLTGAGRGGAAIALVDDPEPVLSALEAAGFEAFVAEIG